MKKKLIRREEKIESNALFFLNRSGIKQIFNRKTMQTEDINKNLHGTISEKLYGDITGIVGIISEKLTGDISNVYGDVTDVEGDIDECEIKKHEKVNIDFLINKKEG